MAQTFSKKTTSAGNRRLKNKAEYINLEKIVIEFRRKTSCTKVYTHTNLNFLVGMLINSSLIYTTASCLFTADSSPYSCETTTTL
ncbi:hypothetical protein BpHYR1_047212 [Brachionus plicatilis]|uniref:Uncharacterized protein n=1 Tax=Brachionus plicatilis TaxID=10195 RepID=A0A3M7R3N1_BRAPC|nr:hypothetical protein BpHYR1_047212 [Brachionus plicatilis]